MQRLQEGSTLWDKTMIKVDQAKESPQLALGIGAGKLPDHLHFLLEWAYTRSIDMKAEEAQLWKAETALLDIDDDPMLFQTLENQS